MVFRAVELESIRQLSKKRKKQDEIVLLAKTKLNADEILISKPLINSYFIHDEVSVNNVLRDHDQMKEGIINPENAVKYFL